jgi:hypothetical protein
VDKLQPKYSRVFSNLLHPVSLPLLTQSILNPIPAYSLNNTRTSFDARQRTEQHSPIETISNKIKIQKITVEQEQ